MQKNARYSQCVPNEAKYGVTDWRNQCGGINYKGSTKCRRGQTCVRVNKALSKCVSPERDAKQLRGSKFDVSPFLVRARPCTELCHTPCRGGTATAGHRVEEPMPGGCFQHGRDCVPAQAHPSVM